MSSFLVINEVEIDASNRCLDDFIQFSKLSAAELNTMHKHNSSELHKLQTELDSLLHELRLLIKAPSTTDYLNCA